MSTVLNRKNSESRTVIIRIKLGDSMNYLFFEDDELDILYKMINSLQICFHPIYAREGQFSVQSTFELLHADKDISIITDKNLVSPICEIATSGILKDKFRMQKVAMLVTWSKYLNARLTCGIGLLENDTSGLSTATGEENRLQFLHGVDNIPANIWKDIAFGYRDEVPERFLYKGKVKEEKEYRFDDNLLLLCNEASVIKIVQLIRTSGMQPIDKFITFMNWYTDNLDIAESIVVYAALVFSNTPHVSQPKKSHSSDFAQVKKGIKNQAWDITYITMWSMQYFNEPNDSCWMFATDDNTQKLIVVNVIPPGECGKAIDAIFQTKSEGEKLRKLYSAKLGNARIRPFENMQMSEKVRAVQKLLSQEYTSLQTIINKDKSVISKFHS